MLCLSVCLGSKLSIPLSLCLCLNRAAAAPNSHLALETGLSRITTSADRLSRPSAFCPNVLTGWLVVVVKGRLGNHLRPGTFFKPPLIWASVRGSPGCSELPHCWQSKETISALNRLRRCETAWRHVDWSALVGWCWSRVRTTGRNIYTCISFKKKGRCGWKNVTPVRGEHVRPHFGFLISIGKSERFVWIWDGSWKHTCIYTYKQTCKCTSMNT